MTINDLIYKAVNDLSPEEYANREFITGEDIEKWLAENKIEPILASSNYEWYGFERELKIAE